MNVTFKTKLLAFIILFFSANAQSVLVSRLGGLAYYDTEADLTWLADAAYLKTLYAESGGTEGDSDGRTSWAYATSWVAGLDVAGVTGWRLPATFDIGNDGCNYSYSGTDCGYYVDYSAGELANLFTNVLGNVPLKTGQFDISPDYNSIPNSGPFINVAGNTGYYWSSTSDVTDDTKAWVFSTSSRDQIVASKTGSSLRVWAVQTGDIAAPAAINTWESTLQARDLDGDLSTIEAFYDTSLDITWLADAALSITESFGVADIFTNGRLPSWEETNDWIVGMNANGGYLGRTDWRLPTILDTSNISEILGQNNDPSRSEMSWLFYITLGNVANNDENGNPNPNPGLENTAHFKNFQAYYYWTGTPYNASYAWAFAMQNGDQYNRAKYARAYALPVLDGDAGTAVYDGDINNNGIVDSGDLYLAMKILLNQYTPTLAEQSRWDVAPLINGAPSPDGQNTLSDYLVLTQKVLGLINF